MTQQGTLFVVSAPSATGKGSILPLVLETDNRLQYSLSATTRKARKGEVNGKHYIFLDEPEFCRWVTEGRFIEWADVHGNLYGTVRQSLDMQLAADADVILELDVQGMRSLREHRDDVVSIFILPPSLEELERRLRGRQSNTEEEIQTRLHNAKAELGFKDEYDYRIVNDKLEDAVAEFEAVIEKARREERNHT